MADDIPNYSTLKAQRVALLCLRAHPLSDTRRIALYSALIEHMDTDRLCFPGTRRLAAITRISRPVVLNLLNEFAKNGLLEFIDPPQKGSRIRRLRLHYERLQVVNSELTTQNAEVVNTGLTTAEFELVNHTLTTEEPRVVNRELSLDKNRVVNFGPPSGQPYIDPNRKQEWFGKPGASAPDPDACGSLAPEKSNVRGKAAPPSNVAVKKKAVVDH
ncbi:hypothetical protein [Paraburkholderia sp. BR13444]|uniref:hypothetical protein n=1 Tax=Paraburkholderia sp. BR13444 TaxID=3236997 RepID=UPI0034CD6738